jgi:hypothetical protein
MISQHSTGLLEILVREQTPFFTGIGYTVELLVFADFLLKHLTILQYQKQVAHSKRLVESHWTKIVSRQEGNAFCLN